MWPLPSGGVTAMDRQCIASMNRDAACGSGYTQKRINSRPAPTTSTTVPAALRSSLA
jgi:hypothetical protein